MTSDFSNLFREEESPTKLVLQRFGKQGMQMKYVALSQRTYYVP